MLAVMCAVIFVISILAAAVFRCSLLFSAAAAVVSAVLLAAEVFLFKKGKLRKLKNVLVFLVAVAGLCVCIYTPIRPTAYGQLDHTELYVNYLDSLLDNKKDKAQKTLDEIIEKYGENDDTRYMRVCALVDDGKLGEAEDVANRFHNSADPYYLLSWETIMMEKYPSQEELYNNLFPLYVKAADDNPDWCYPAKQAGGMYYDRGEYDKAEYYLTRAMIYSEEEV